MQAAQNVQGVKVQVFRRRKVFRGLTCMPVKVSSISAVACLKYAQMCLHCHANMLSLHVVVALNCTVLDSDWHCTANIHSSCILFLLYICVQHCCRQHCRTRGIAAAIMMVSDACCRVGLPCTLPSVKNPILEHGWGPQSLRACWTLNVMMS